MKKTTAFLLAVWIIFCFALAETFEGISVTAFDDCQVYVSPLDKYGRAGSAFAIISRSSIDSHRRDEISMFLPSGYRTIGADVEGGWLFNRTHLVADQLTSGTGCIENLITGTHHLNVDGMLPIEIKIRTYVTQTGEHVLYRVTPIYQGAELIPRAVEVTAYSVETDGLRFTQYLYNVEPGYEIDYATGDSGGEFRMTGVDSEPVSRSSAGPDYVLNVKSMRFHHPWCSGVESMSEKNRQDYYGDRESLINQGYKPCGTCNP